VSGESASVSASWNVGLCRRSIVLPGCVRHRMRRHVSELWPQIHDAFVPIATVLIHARLKFGLSRRCRRYPIAPRNLAGAPSCSLLNVYVHEILQTFAAERPREYGAANNEKRNVLFSFTVTVIVLREERRGGELRRGCNIRPSWVLIRP